MNDFLPTSLLYFVVNRCMLFMFVKYRNRIARYGHNNPSNIIMCNVKDFYFIS